jgi:NAD(P)-dependent dehydrogenase (short-subunit alcohol dehydrogenase family)
MRGDVMSGKVWFVTGASRGLGAEIAKGILAAGDSLVATARKTEALDYLGAPENLLKVALDVTNEAQVEKAVSAALARFGRIDVVVNNAGYGLLGAVEESSAEEVEGVYRTNVFGLLNVVRAVLPSMRARHSGHIMNISSVGGYAGYQGWGIYGSTKFAVEGITEAMYAELKPLGIHATVVEPGFFRTNFLDASSLIETKARIGDYAETVGQMREFAGGHNGQQPGDPAKLAQVLLRLASMDQPPLRLPLGSDTVARVVAKNAFVAEQTERWKDLSLSTDF